MELYKYCKRAHVPLNGTGGALRIGTLYDYRKTDKYGELTSDVHEGRKQTSGTALHLNAENIHLYPVLENLINIGASGRVGKLEVSNCTVGCPNMFVFSASQEYSRSEHERWHEEEGYDACYRINSARLFFREISRVLGVRGRFLGFAPVHYVESFDLSSPDIHPALVKRQLIHQGQQEVRAIWQFGDGVEAKPLDLTKTNVGWYCTLHYLLGE